jgi:hypothetical protein
MEQESDKLEKETQKETQVTSVNQQGGVHQEGGASSSGPIQGGEQPDIQPDIQMATKRNSKSEDKRMGESNADVNMKASGKRQREERTEDDPEEQAAKYATVEIQEEEGTIRNISWVCSFSHNQEFYDDVIGKKLKTELVLKARAEQMGEVVKFGVYSKVPIQNCWNDTGKDPIGVRWLNVNKGDEANPEIRCRIVAQ